MILSVHQFAMRDRLLRAMDRRDPWEATDLTGWLAGHYPEQFNHSEELFSIAADFADDVAIEIADDPAFPKIVSNLRAISLTLREKANEQAGFRPIN